MFLIFSMGVEGLELFSGNAANCGAKPIGDVSAVAQAVALRPISDDLRAIVLAWESLDDTARSDLLTVARGLAASKGGTKASG